MAEYYNEEARVGFTIDAGNYTVKEIRTWSFMES